MKNCTGENCIIQYDKVDPATCPCVSYCPEATPPKTNADRIRAMSDEELAHLLNECVCPIDECPHYYEDRSCTKAECEKCWLDWLRQETMIMKSNI